MEVYRGFLNVSQDNITYNRVTDLALNRPIWQRPFGTGTVNVNTAGNKGGISQGGLWGMLSGTGGGWLGQNSQVEAKIKYVPDPESVYNQLRQVCWEEDFVAQE